MLPCGAANRGTHFHMLIRRNLQRDRADSCASRGREDSSLPYCYVRELPGLTQHEMQAAMTSERAAPAVILDKHGGGGAAVLRMFGCVAFAHVAPS